jgi:hypothetical protein
MAESILVVADNAGGANLVAAWCAENEENQFTFCVSDSALVLFGEILGNVENHPIADLEERVKTVDRVVCGTSENPEVVHRAILLARQHGVASATFLDHWFGYRRRFHDSESELTDLPDEIWVTDQYARTHAVLEGFPESVIKVQGSPYIERVARAAREMGAGVPTEQKGILFLSEPIANVSELTGAPLEDVGFDEYQLVEDVILAVGDSGNRKLILRMHPSEPADQYADLLREISGDVDVVVSSERDLAVDLARATAVVGSNSTALVVAAEAGLRTFSYIPESGRPCVLPHDTITKVRDRTVLAESLRALV